MIRVDLDGRLLSDIQQLTNLARVRPRPGEMLWVHCHLTRRAEPLPADPIGRRISVVTRRTRSST